MAQKFDLNYLRVLSGIPAKPPIVEAVIEEAFGIKLASGKWVMGERMSTVGPNAGPARPLSFSTKAKADDWLVMQSNNKSGAKFDDAQVKSIPSNFKEELDEVEEDLLIEGKSVTILKDMTITNDGTFVTIKRKHMTEGGMKRDKMDVAVTDVPEFVAAITKITEDAERVAEGVEADAAKIIAKLEKGKKGDPKLVDDFIDSDRSMLIGKAQKMLQQGWTDAEVESYMGWMEYFTDANEDTALARMKEIKAKVLARGVKEDVEPEAENTISEDQLAEFLNPGMGSSKLSRVHVGQLSKGDFPELRGKVFMIRNESPVIENLIDLLGIPSGEGIQIRTGFMCYDEKRKMLFFSKYKADLPTYMNRNKKPD